MNFDWRGFACGLLMMIGGALAGFSIGQWQGEKNSELAAMSGVVDHCFIADPPAFCWAMLDAINGTYAEPSDDNPFGFSNQTEVY